MLKEIIIVKSGQIISEGFVVPASQKNCGDFIDPGKNPVVFISEPLLAPKKPSLKNAIFLAFHDVVPTAMKNYEISGMTPFDWHMAKAVLDFVDPFVFDAEKYTLYVACPHGRARGNSVAAGLNFVYRTKLSGSVVPESVNKHILHFFEIEGRAKAIERSVFGAEKPPRPNKK